ncbi:DUF4886 domain-containing protein [Glaciecola sp. 1036]|uniref:DUF4886 domain-containing protein n=1 Tax=Alteromonadaceae TaxID=72275 RepID=UPI003D04C8F9
MLNIFKLILIFASLCFMVTTCTTQAIEKAQNPVVDPIEPAPKKILFVGNSFSFYNNGIHNHLGSLIRAAGEWKRGENRLRLQTLSGGHIFENLPMLQAHLQIVDDSWQAVVLQGHSNEPIRKNKRKKFQAAIDAAIKTVKEKGMSPILFMTWSYADTAGMTESLKNAYVDAAQRNNILLVPVGLAFDKAAKTLPSINLFVPDVTGVTEIDGKKQIAYGETLKHPSAAGTYLAACVFYGALYNKSPEGNIFHSSLTSEQALALQKLSWQVVSDFRQHND